MYISNTEIVNTTISEPMIIWVRQVERYQALANAVQISLIIINILQLELQKTLKQVKNRFDRLSRQNDDICVAK